MKTIKLLSRKAILAVLAAAFLVSFMFACVFMHVGVTLSAESPYYTADISAMTKHDFSETGLVSDPETDVYTSTGLKEFFNDNALGTTLDTTFTASFMFAEGANVGFPISFRRSGWSDDQKINIYADGKVELYKARQNTFETFSGTAFTAGTWYYLDYTVANIYTDAALEEQTGYRLVVSITDKAAYSAEYSVDMTNAELAQTDLEYNTGNFFLWIPVELSGCVSVASYQFDPNALPEPSDPVDPDAGYTKDIADMPEIDFLAVGLIFDPYAGVYTDTGLKEFFEGNAPGTTLDTTFTAAIKFEEGANVGFPISFRRSGWNEGLKLNIYPDGKVWLYKADADNASNRKEFEGEAFTPGTWYYVKYTVANLYSDEDLTQAIGYRSTVNITDKANYNVTYTYSYTFEDTGNTEYTTGNFFMWIGNELSGHFGVASYQYDPETTPGGGEEPEGPDTPAEPTGYTKDIADMPEIDFLEVGLISDPYAGVYTDTGLKEFFEGNAPGTTLDTTFTAAIKFEEGANVGFPISFRRSGWNEGLKLNIYPDGKVWLYKADADNASNRKEFEGEAFTPGTWYYVKYTVANLYSDEDLTQAIGYRSTVNITDKANYNVTYTYSYTFEDTGNTEYTTGNFFMWIGNELGGHFGVASYRFDPSAEPAEYYSAVDIDEAEVLEISEKITMNADGFLLSAYTQEQDGFYANFSQELGNGVYEMNKTLRYRLQGSGSFHTAYAGDWIWNSYKVDFDYNQNTITVGLGGSNTEVFNPSPALDPDTIYLVEITIIEYFREDNDEKAYEMLYVRIYVDGEETPFVDKSYQFTNPIIPASGARDYLGFYMGLTGNVLRVMPADFSRDYAVTLVNGDNNNQVATSYGEPYDFTQYAVERTGYEFEGWECYIGGVRRVIPSTGEWIVDFTTQTSGIYSGTLTAVYTPVEYKVNYVIDGGTNSAENPATINVEDGAVTLAAAVPDTAGEVFFGWYLTADFTGDPVTQIECTYEEITLYARIADGCTLTFILPDGGQYSVSAETNTTYTLPTQTSEGYEEITGWQLQSGDSWTDVSGASVTVSGDAVYRAVAQPIAYTITYELGGGTNSAENPATYTIEDSVTFVNPEREGYFFIGWYENDEMIRGIVVGSMGNISVEARWVEDTIPASTTYTVSENAVLLPVPSGLPAGSHYTVALYDAQDYELQVVSNAYTFDTVGSYKLVYTLTLPSGTYTREMQITVEEGSDTPDPGSDSSIDSGSDTGSEGTASGGCNGCGGTLSMAFVGLPALAAAAVLIVRKKHTDD